ncbi:MAG: ABC transporter substrate-binding protein [Propionibacteriaceae bacterium]|nr:ABC transporter substrate-binding protein [Propionibacteriaceae bacterium]
MKLAHKLLAVPALFALGLTACSTSTQPSSSGSSAAGDKSSPATSKPAGNCEGLPQGNGETIYLVSKGFQHRFWQAVKQGAEQAGAECGYKVEFVGPDDETKTSQQLDQLETALATNPVAIGFAALDSAAAVDVISRIEQAGIPIIAFDSGVESEVPVTTVSTDNEAAAAEAAKHMVELIGGKGKVGVVCHDQTSTTGKQRCDGFQNYIKENAPEVELLEPQVAGSVDLATNASKSLIQSTPDIAGIYGTNEAAATGAVNGAAESGNDKLVVVGFDSGKTQIDAIKAGTEAGAVTQAPVKMGYETVIAAVKAINGQTLDKAIDSGFAWYDKNNVDDPAIAENLYE